MKSSTKSGFTLVEIVVAMGLLGLLSLAVLKIVDLQLAGGSRANQDQIIAGMTLEMNTLLADAKSCWASLHGETPGTYKDPSSTNKYRIAQGFVKNGVVYAEEPRYTPLDLVMNQIKVTDMQLVWADGAATHAAGTNTFNLEVTIQRLGKTVGANTRRIIIKAKGHTDASGKVLDCYSYDTTAIETGITKSCEQLGGTLDPADQKCKYKGKTIAQWIDDLSRPRETATEWLTPGKTQWTPPAKFVDGSLRVWGVGGGGGGGGSATCGGAGGNLGKLTSKDGVNASAIALTTAKTGITCNVTIGGGGGAGTSSIINPSGGGGGGATSITCDGKTVSAAGGGGGSPDCECGGCSESSKSISSAPFAGTGYGNSGRGGGGHPHHSANGGASGAIILEYQVYSD